MSLSWLVLYFHVLVCFGLMASGYSVVLLSSNLYLQCSFLPHAVGQNRRLAVLSLRWGEQYDQQSIAGLMKSPHNQGHVIIIAQSDPIMIPFPVPYREERWDVECRA